MQSFLEDLRYAFRTLRKSPGYAAIALATLALGIGANTAIFSVVKGTLLNPLPYPDADRLVRIWELNAHGGSMQGAWRNFIDFRERSRSLDDLVAHGSGGESTVLGTGRPLRVGTTSVSAGFFRLLRVEPALGRAFVPEEHQLGGDPAVIVSDGFWRTHLGGQTDLSDRTLIVGGNDARIVGVMPPGFDYPGDVDVWYPIEQREQTQSRSAHNWFVIGRLAPGADIERADAELDAITAGFLKEDPGVADETWFEDYFPREVRIESLRDAVIGDAGRPLGILLGASALLLLLACTNLASGTLARGTNREREIALRQSLGAGRGRIVKQLFTESLALAVTGGALGLLLAATVVRVLPALTAALPRMDEVRLDPLVFVFALVVSVATAALFGLVPALRVSSAQLSESLRSGARAGVDPVSKQIWRWLIGGNVALAIVLLIGSGLLIRSFQSVLSVRPGFRVEGILMATVNPPSAKYGEPEAKRVYYDELLRELRTIPGVAEMGVVTRAPMSWVSNGMVAVRGSSVEAASGDYQLVDAGYFKTLGIPLIRGRLFDERDHEDAPHAIIINQAFADVAWPGEDPIGKQMNGGGMDDYWDQDVWATVIGVVGDIRQRDLTREPDPTYYFYYRQRPFRAWSMTVALRPAGGRADLPTAVREAVRRVDSDVPVSFASIERLVSEAVAERRFTMLVLGVFAGVALALACVGIYGVVAYTVARRTREIGIRIALGAEPVAVRRLVQRESLTAAAIGGAAGVLGAFALTRVMTSLLYGVSPTDPLTFAAVAGALGAAAWLASYIPALPSTRVDPMVAMRAE